MALKTSARSESGFAIIEAVVSAAVLAIVAMAVLAGVDAASSSSGREKARAVGAIVAEQDQERLRGMSVDTLKATPLNTRTVQVDGVNYSVQSKVALVTDDFGGTPACGASTNKAEYFHITSTVTSVIVGTRIKPIKIDSLVSPSVAFAQKYGSFGVKVIDRNGVGMPGLSVGATGPSALASQVTDTNGCVIWRSIPIGTYTATISRAGSGDESGVQTVSRTQSVSPNTVTFVHFTYDVLVSASVSVWTHTPGTAFATTSTKASKALEISDSSTRPATPRVFPASPATGASTFSLLNTLFPFPTTAYGFYTGGCAYESPAVFTTPPVDYFTTINPGASVIVSTTLPNSAKVFQPPVNMRVTRGYANSQPAVGRIEVHFTLKKPAAFTTDPCVEAKTVMTIMDWPGGVWGTDPPPGAFATNGQGWVTQTTAAYDPGLPFGNYSVCLVDRTVPATPRRHLAADYNNTTANGSSLVNITATGGTNWPTGTCP